MLAEKQPGFPIMLLKKIMAADILQVDWSRHLQKAEDGQIVLSTGTTTVEHYPFTPTNRNGTAL